MDDYVKCIIRIYEKYQVKSFCKSRVGPKHAYIDKTPQLSDVNPQFKTTGLEDARFTFNRPSYNQVNIFLKTEMMIDNIYC